jgi:hypothetical protein
MHAAARMASKAMAGTFSKLNIAWNRKNNQDYCYNGCADGFSEGKALREGDTVLSALSVIFRPLPMICVITFSLSKGLFDT